jgi:hypothetical protein
VNNLMYIIFIVLAGIGFYIQFETIFKAKKNYISFFNKGVNQLFMLVLLVAVICLMYIGISSGNKEICFFLIVPIVALLAALKLGVVNTEKIEG